MLAGAVPCRRRRSLVRQPGNVVPEGAQLKVFSVQRIVLVALLIFGILQAATLSADRRFSVDEMQHIHAAYNIASGRLIYRDFWEAHNPLLYEVLTPVIDPNDAAGSFQHARFAVFPLFLGALVFASLTAWRLGGPVAGAATATLLLFNSTMVERGIEVRPDVALACCIAAAVFIETLSLERGRRNVLEAVALSVGFLFTQKAAFASVAFGAWWLIEAIRSRNARLVLAPALAWCVLPAVMLTMLAYRGNLVPYLNANVVDNLKTVTRTADHGMWLGAERFIYQEALRNIVFATLALAAFVLLAWKRQHPFLLAVGATLFASLFINPYPYPYFQVTVIPTLAVVAGIGIATILATEQPPTRESAVIVVALVAWLSSRGHVEKLMSLTNADQFALLDEIERITQPDDAMLDLHGLHFRPDAYPVASMTAPMRVRYELGELPRLIPSLRKTEMVAMIVSPRLETLPADEREFLIGHTTAYDRQVWVLGCALSGLRAGDTLTFDVLKEKRFHFEGGGRIRIDGREFQGGTLTRGLHVITAVTDIDRGRLILELPRPQPTALKQIYSNVD